jgi:Ni,Fe-hydrogenase III large subunit
VVGLLVEVVVDAGLEAHFVPAFPAGWRSIDPCNSAASRNPWQAQTVE